MKNLFIADTVTTIKESDNHPVTLEMIETLDSMLNEYGVTHFFSYPIDSTNGIANNQEDFLSVAYDSKDRMTFDLVYMLWSKTVRNIEDDKLYKAMKKISTRYTIQD